MKSPAPHPFPTPNTHNSKARGPTTAKYRRISRIPVTGQATATPRGCGGPRCGQQETWQGVGGGDSARTTSVGCAGVGGGGWCLNRNNTNIRPHGPRLHLLERTCAKSRRRAVVSTPAVSIGVCGIIWPPRGVEQKRDARPVAASWWCGFVPGRRDMCTGRPESRGGGPSSPGSLRAPVEVGYGSASLQDPVRGAANPAFVDSGGSTPVGPVGGLVPTGYVL